MSRDFQIFFPVHKCNQREQIELHSVTSQVCMCSLDCLGQHWPSEDGKHYVFSWGCGGLTMHSTCVSYVFDKLLDAIIWELIRGRTPLRNTSEALKPSHQLQWWSESFELCDCVFGIACHLIPRGMVRKSRARETTIKQLNVAWAGQDLQWVARGRVGRRHNI